MGEFRLQWKKDNIVCPHTKDIYFFEQEGYRGTKMIPVLDLKTQRRRISDSLERE